MHQWQTTIYKKFISDVANTHERAMYAKIFQPKNFLLASFWQYQSSQAKGQRTLRVFQIYPKIAQNTYQIFFLRPGKDSPWLEEDSYTLKSVLHMAGGKEKSVQPEEKFLLDA